MSADKYPYIFLAPNRGYYLNNDTVVQKSLSSYHYLNISIYLVILYIIFIPLPIFKSPTTQVKQALYQSAYALCLRP